MPKLSIDMFDESPKVGDKVRVIGKINHIDEDSGEVDVSYDKVSVVNKRKSSDKSSDAEDLEPTMDDETAPNDQSLDSALMKAFPNTQ